MNCGSCNRIYYRRLVNERCVVLTTMSMSMGCVCDMRVRVLFLLSVRAR